MSHIEGCQAADALKQSLIASGMSGREGGGGDLVSGSHSSSKSFLRHEGEARKWSAKSDGTLKHSDSLTWYDALRVGGIQ